MKKSEKFYLLLEKKNEYKIIQFKYNILFKYLTKLNIFLN